jgi:uncharacterized protein (DUF58 family)
VKKRIYAFPNRFGFIGFLLFVVIILAGGTYQNNLIYMMGFLLLSLGLIAILQTARNLRDIEVISVHIEPHFAGQPTTAWVTIKNKSKTLKLSIAATIEEKKKLATVNFDVIEPLSTVTASVLVTLPLTRGEHQLRRLRIGTTYPYALFQTWTFLATGQKYLVYPRLLENPPPLPEVADAGGDDFSGHKTYEPTDNLNRVDWKIYSRQQQMMVKQFKEGAEKSLFLDWKNIEAPDFETRVSQLATWIVMAEKNGYDYQLRLPTLASPVAHGSQQYHYCLESLARHT